MKIRLLFTSILAALCLLAAQTSNAQFNTGTITLDGTASEGAYITSGAYSIAWDDNYLYVRYAGGNFDEPVILHVDTDPQVPVDGGGNANGNLTGQANWGITPTLPFRSNFMIYWESQYAEYRTSNGSGGWNTNTVITTTDRSNNGTNDREIRLSWTAMMGLGARPSAFNWTAFANSRATPGFIFNQRPSDNPSGALASPTLNYYYTVSSTANNANITDPFAQRSFETRSSMTHALGAQTYWDYYVTGGATLTFAPTGTQTINNAFYIATSSTFIPQNSGGARAITLGSASGNTPSVTCNGTLTPNNGSGNDLSITAAFGTTTIQGSAANTAYKIYNLTVNNGATVQAPSSGTVDLGWQFGTITVNSGGTLNLVNGSGVVNLTNSGTASNTLISNAGTMTLNSLTINAGNTINPVSSGTHNVSIKKDFNSLNVTANTFDGVNSTGTLNLDFNGTTSQTISSSAAITFRGLTISNTSSDVTYSSSAIATISGTAPAGSLTIASGARLHLNPGSGTAGVLTLASGATGTVNGFLRQSGPTGTTIVTNSNLTFSSTGTYEHNFTTVSGSIPTATWSTGSTCLIMGYTSFGGPVSSSFNQTFSNFTWDTPNQSATNNVQFNALAATPNILGNFSVLRTGGQILRLGSSGSFTFNVGGNFIVNSATGSATLNLSNGSTATINIGGNFSLTQPTNTANLTQTAGTVTINFNKASGTQTFTHSGGTISGTIGWNVGTGVTTNTLQFATSATLSAGTFAVLNNASVDFQTFTLSGSGGFTPATGSTLITANTSATGALMNTGANGSVQTTTRTFTNTGVHYVYNGAAAQITGTAPSMPASIGNLTINNSSGGVTQTGTIVATGTLALQSGILTLGAPNLTFGTLSGTFPGSSTSYVKTTSTGQVRTVVAASAVTFPVGNSAYNPITLTNSGTSDTYGIRVIDGAVANANDNTYAVNREWVVTEVVAGGSNLAVLAQYNSGEEGTNFASGTTPKIGLYNGATWQQQTATPAGAGPFTYTSNANFTPTDLATAGTRYFAVGKDDAFAPAAVSYYWHGATDANWATATNWAPNGVPGSGDDVRIKMPGTNTLDITSARTVTNFTLDSVGLFTMSSAGTLTINGNVTYGGTATATLDPASTVVIASGSGQTIPPLNYGNLDASGGARTIASGTTVGIAGTFTPGSSNTLTGSTVDFNGTGAQTINTLNYANLTISGSRGTNSVTLASGTIGVSGTFSPTATFSSGNYINTGNTFDFNGTGAQTVPAFDRFNNLTISGARGAATVTLSSGTIGVSGTFSPSATSVIWSTTGNTFDYTSASGQTIAGFNKYNNLSNSGNGTRILSSAATIVIDGTYTPTTAAVTVGTSTVDFSSASSQPIPATFYNIVTNSGNGDRVWASSGTIDINATFTPGSGTHTITGSTVQYSSTAAVTYNLTNFTTNVANRRYNNLIFVGGASTAWNPVDGTVLGIAGNLSITGAGQVTGSDNGTNKSIVVDGNATIGGTGRLRVATSTGTGSFTVTGALSSTSTATNPIIITGGAGAGSITAGSYSQSGASANTVIVSNAAGAGSMTVNGTFAMSGTASAFNVVGATTAPSTTVTVNGNVTVAGTAGINLEAANSTTGVGTFTVTGDATFTSTGSNIVNFGTGTNAGNTFNIGGNFSKSGTGSFNTSGTTAATGFVFNKAGTQTFSYAGTNSNFTQYVVASGSTLQMLTGLTLGTGNNPASSFTVNSGGTLDMGSQVITAGDATNSAFTLSSGGNIKTSAATGLGANFGGTYGSGKLVLNSGANYEFNGAATGTFTTTPTALTVNNLTINRSAGVTLSNALTVNGTLFMTDGILALGANTLTMGASGTVNTPAAGSFVNTNSTGLFKWTTIAQSASKLFPIGNTTYTPLTITNQQVASADFSAKVATPVTGTIADATKIVDLQWFITSTSTNADVQFQWNAANEAASYNAATAAGTDLGRFNGVGYSITTSGLTPAVGPPRTVTATGLTTFSGTNQYVLGNTNAVALPFTDYYWHGATDSDWATATNWSPNGVPGSVDNVRIKMPGTNTLNLTSARSVANFTLDSVGNFTVSAIGSLTIAGNVTYGGTATATLDPASTVTISNSGAQTIPPLAYGNLDASGGARTIASGTTVGIAGTFTPGSSNTLTGSTVNYYGSGAQTVVAGLTYHNLGITGSRTTNNVTLGTGTITIAGTYNPTATFSSGTVVTTGNTIDFSSAGTQPIPAFIYGSITNTGNGTRTWANSGTIEIQGSFTPGSGTHTITGSTVNYSRTDAGTFSLVTFTTNVTTPARQYNNLIVGGGGSTVWQQTNAFNMGVAGNFTYNGAGSYTVCAGTTGTNLSVDGDLTVSGSGSFRVINNSGGGISSTAAITGNTTVSSGALVIAGTTVVTGATGTLTTASLTVSGTGSVVLDQGSTTGRGLLVVAGAVNVTSSSATAINLGSGTSNGTSTTTGNILSIGGNFTKSGSGALAFSGTFSTFSGYLFNGATPQNWSYAGTGMTGGNFTVLNGSTLNLTTNFTMGTNAQTSIFLVDGVLDDGGFSVIAGHASNLFNMSATGVLRTANAGGVGGTASGFASGSTFAAGATFAYTGTTQNSGLSGYAGIGSTTAYNLTWAGTTSLTMDKSMTITTFNFSTNGLVSLGSFNITIPATGSITGSGFGASKMFVTIGTGALVRAVTSAGVGIPFTWPIGETTGSAEYSPVTIGNISAASTGSIGFRVTDGTHPNNGPATSYISRYWTFSMPASLGSYNFTNATFTYDAGDIVVGPEASFKANVWSVASSGWIVYSSSSAASNVLTVTSGPNTSTLVSGDDITARIDVPVYYRTTGLGTAWATATNWEVSTDPTFASPTPVPASIAPNAVNSGGITVQTGHTINVTVATTHTADQMLVESGGILNVNSNNFNLVDGAGTDLTVNGTVNVNSSGVFTSASGSAIAISTGGYFKNSNSLSVNGSMTVDGTYEHNQAGGTIPASTWNTGSLTLVTGTLASLPSGLAQSFYDFTWNCPSQSASVNLAGSTLGPIQHDLTFVTTNSLDFRLGGVANVALTVGNDVNVQGGFLILNSGAVTGSSTVSIGRDLNISNAGTFQCFTTSGSATTGTRVTVGRDVNMAGTTGTRLALAGSIANSVASLRVGRHFNHTGTGTTRLTASASTDTLFVAGNFTHSAGTISSTGAGISRIIFNGAVPQVFTSGGTVSPSGAINWNVNSGSILDIPNGNVVTGSAFTAPSGSTLRIGSTVGITSSGATGNVQTTTRTYDAGANYVYNGTANQVTGNGLPSPITGSLGVANTGTSGNNTVTLSTGRTTSVLNLDAGLFAAGTSQTLVMSTGGVINGNGGDFASGTASGLINFVGTGSFTGNSNPYNVDISGGVNFGAGTVTFQNGGMLRIFTGGFVNANAPFYGTGSTLQYNVNAVYGRNTEWSASSGRGFPHHVQLSNNTTLNPANTGASNAAVALNTGGDLTIDAGSSLYMDYSGNNMTADLVIGGNLNLVGNLSGSGATGADIFLAGNWVNNGTGANWFPNGRAVFFDGTAAQSIGGTNTTLPTFDYLLVNKAGTSPNNTVTITEQTTINTGATITQGFLQTGPDTLVMASASTLTETFGTTDYYVLGNVKTVHNIGTGASSFSGIGVEIDAGSNLGTVTAIRHAGTAITGQSPCCSGNQGIKRFWKVQPTVQPAVANRTLTFFWPDSEDNSVNPLTARVWKSPDGIAPYSPVDIYQDVSATDPRAIHYGSIPSFSFFTVSDLDSPLPLGLIKFNGKKENGAAALTWTMTNEQDVSGFTIEKSIDGKTFQAIGYVKSLENGRRSNDYRFVDKQLTQDSYYRLVLKKPFDRDELTEMVIVKMSSFSKRAISLFPNPASRGAQVAVNGQTEWSELVRVDLIGTDGRIIAQLEGQLTDVNRSLSSRIESLPTGPYHVRVTTQDDVKTLKLMKK